MQCNMQYSEHIELRESDEVNITICGEETPFSNTPSLFPNNPPLFSNNAPLFCNKWHLCGNNLSPPNTKRPLV